MKALREAWERRGERERQALGTLGVLVAVTLVFSLVWLPLASHLWTTDRPIAGTALAVLALASAYLVDHLGERLTMRLVHRRTLWLSFLLFLSLVGGLIAFGPSGLVIAPTAVVSRLPAASSCTCQR